MCIVHCQLCFHMSGSWEILFVMFYFRRVATHKKCLCSIWPKSFVGAGCKAIRLLLEAKMHTRRTMHAMSNPKSTVRIAFSRTYRSRNFTCRSWAIGQTGGAWVYSVTFGTKAQSSLKQSWKDSYKGVSRVESKSRIGGHDASCTWLLMQFGHTVIVCQSHTCKRLQKSIFKAEIEQRKLMNASCFQMNMIFQHIAWCRVSGWRANTMVARFPGAGQCEQCEAMDQRWREVSWNWRVLQENASKQPLRDISLSALLAEWYFSLLLLVSFRWFIL